MYIRRKIKTRKGQKYEQHQLVKSVRTERGPRQQVVLNMGELTLPKEHWKTLANAIEAILNNQSLFDFEQSERNEEVEKLAGHYAQMIIRKTLNIQQDKQEQDDAGNEASPPSKTDFCHVDIHSVRSSQSRSIGAEYVIAEQMDQYQFDDILKQLDLSPKQIDYARLLVIGRAVHPSSERELARWINDDSAVRELINSEQAVYDNALHRTAVLLWEHQNAIQKKLRVKAAELFSLSETIILYDLTNTYFEGKKTGSEKARFGRSKEQRSDCKLMTLALVVDSLGFPKESHILEGNVSEPGTLAQMLESIKNLGKSNEKKTVVIDAGIATEENIALLKAEQIAYIAISRKQSYDPLIWAESEEKKLLLNDKKNELTVKLAIVGEQTDAEDAREAFLLCHSPQKEIKEQQIAQKRMDNFEAALKQINAGLSKPRAQNKYGKIMERIGRLKQKFQVGKDYDIALEQTNGKVHAITFKKNPNGQFKSEKFGQYVIRTDRVDLNEEEISALHRSLTTIESSFRAMKSDLGLRPNYHKSEEATTAHIFLTVLAYHMVCPILKRLSHSGIDYTWNSVRNILASHDRVVTSFNTREQDCVHIRNTTTANLNQKNIYNALGLKHDPLKNIVAKTKITITRGM